MERLLPEHDHSVKFVAVYDDGSNSQVALHQGMSSALCTPRVPRGLSVQTTHYQFPVVSTTRDLFSCQGWFIQRDPWWQTPLFWEVPDCSRYIEPILVGHAHRRAQARLRGLYHPARQRNRPA